MLGRLRNMQRAVSVLLVAFFGKDCRILTSGESFVVTSSPSGVAAPQSTCETKLVFLREFRGTFSFKNKLDDFDNAVRQRVHVEHDLACVV